jgi:glycosyltransferase involved in cell wall biosynthesis
MPPSISIVFPMYNEEAYIHRAIRAAAAVLAEVAPDHEIIIVDDASTDRTGALADELARADPRIKVVHNERNRTLGGAVRLLEYQQADVLAAYRFDRTSEGLVRTVYSFCYNLLIRALFGLAVKDVNFSFKLFHRSLLQKVTLKSEGSFIDAEFLVRARKAGASVIQIGVDYFPRSRGISTLSSPGVILMILREMARLRGELR